MRVIVVGKPRLDFNAVLQNSIDEIHPFLVVFGVRAKHLDKLLPVARPIYKSR